jgi:hypothetical protein
MQQLSLPFHLNESSLKTYLEKSTGKEVSLVVTDNSDSLLSVKTAKSSMAVRLHWIFLSADSDVLDEIAGFAGGVKRRTPKIRRFIDQNTHCVKERPPRTVRIRSRGKYHDLAEMFNSVNSEYFDGRVSASITWSVKGRRRSAMERTLGSFSQHNNLIRINPILDSRRVPRYFLEFIIYHEMLHAEMGIEDYAGRRSLHSREFKKKERLFKHYTKALEWEKKRF